MNHVVVATDGCKCNSMTLIYYDADSCQYLGLLDNSSSSFATHSGHCPRCAKRQIKIIDSLLQKNLKEFFELKLK